MCDDLSIRSMEQDDIALVRQIETSTDPFGWDGEILSFCLSVSYFDAWVLEKSGQLIGFSVVSRVNEEHHLLKIALHPKMQNQGYGAWFLRTILKKSVHAKAKNMLLEVRCSNDSAIHLYQQHDFEQIGVREKYYPTATGREDALIFNKKLNGQ